jgi:UDP-N-acetylglucosamine diphosphorylase / glucose-1-phosphate thymidylyltransferase / UDP-N-acetylgalactosamine diphosphorylase / glucosamine-1-phosphate N-acetyltransferase / galactosamine-1-phosphate N-acetyltransferase
MLPVYLFDDALPELQPLTGLRCSFELRVGAFSLIERLTDAALRPEGLLLWGALVGDDMAALVRERWGVTVNDFRSGRSDTPVLLLNGRCAVPQWAHLASLRPGAAVVEPETDALVAACVPEHFAARVLSGDRSGLRIEAPERRVLMSRPWHARTFRDAAIADGIDAAVRSGRLKGPREIRIATVLGDVWAAESARVYPGAILDAGAGPIVLADKALIRPGAIVIGPAYVGPNSTILERATIRPNTAIGPWCKVNGELSGVAFQGYSNKAHDGFLGDSWVGEWVNLGAGTTNSNLLNTYGEVVSRALPGSANERTGEQFLGAIIGDHAKTAICTRIMTGAVIHTGAMLAATAPVSGCIPPFAWITDDGSRTYRLAKFVEVMEAAMTRRGITPGPAYRARLEQLHSAVAGR